MTSLIFNRHALFAYYEDVSPFGGLNELPGYTPDVVRYQTLLGRVARLLEEKRRKLGKVPGQLGATMFRPRFSGARNVKTGGALESGNVEDIISGFEIRALEAQQEKSTRDFALALLQRALKPVPAAGVPPLYTEITKAELNKILRAIYVGQRQLGAAVRKLTDQSARVRAYVPAEIFEGDDPMSQLAPGSRNLTVFQHIARAEITSAMLKAVGFHKVDGSVKTIAHLAALAAHARVAAHKAGVKGPARAAFIERWMRNPEMQAEIAAKSMADLYIFNYKNIPFWLDSSSRVLGALSDKDPLITPAVNAVRALTFLFWRFTYSYARLLKRPWH